MTRLALTFLVGVFLFVAGGTGGAWAAPLNACFIYLTNVGDHGWTYAHELARRDLQQHFGNLIKTDYKTNVPEGIASKAQIRKFAESGCNIIFTTSFGYMDATAEVAKQFPNVKFVHISGYKRQHNLATGNIRYYEGKYLQGVIAGLMTKTNRIGFVAPFPTPEVYMQINAFAIGARETNPSAKIYLKWVDSWYDPVKETDAANSLLAQGVDILNQGTDSPAVLQTAQQAGVYGFGNGTNLHEFAPKAHLFSYINNWSAYYIDVVDHILQKQWNNGPAPNFWSGDTWEGVSENFIIFSPFTNMPDNVVNKAYETKKHLVQGHQIFSGPLYDNNGTLKLASPNVSDDDLWRMDYFVEGVDEYPFNKNIVQITPDVLPSKPENKIASDTQVPLITITQSGANGRKGTIKGFAKDNIQIAEVLIDGNAVSVGSDGSFEWSGFVPATGKDIIVEAIDTAALSSTQVIRLERGQIQQASGPIFAEAQSENSQIAEKQAIESFLQQYTEIQYNGYYCNKQKKWYAVYLPMANKIELCLENIEKNFPKSQVNYRIKLALSHEAVHLAQDCKAGTNNTKMHVLNKEIKVSKYVKSRYTKDDHKIEAEAWKYQDTNKPYEFVKKYCNKLK